MLAIERRSLFNKRTDVVRKVAGRPAALASLRMQLTFAAVASCIMSTEQLRSFELNDVLCNNEMMDAHISCCIGRRYLYSNCGAYNAIQTMRN